MLRPRVEPPRLGSTICYGQTWARKSHQDSAVRVVTAKSWPERATKTRQYDLLRPNVGQKEPPRPASTICYQKKPPRLGNTICYGQTWAKSGPERFGNTICYGQEWARKRHQDSAVRFVTAKSWPERTNKPNHVYSQECARKSRQDSAVRFVTAKSWPEKATKTRQYDLLRPNVGQNEPPRLGSTICYGQTWARKSHQDSAVRFVTAKRGPERATKTRQYDVLRPRVGQKKPPRLGSTICYGQELARKSHKTRALLRPNVGQKSQKEPSRLGSTICYGQELGQKEPPRLGSTICYGQTWARKSHQDSAVRLVTAKRGPERAIKTRQYDLLRPNVGQKEPSRLGSTICYGQKKPPRLGSTICYGQTWARKSHQGLAVRFVTAECGPERATKTRQYDLLRPNVGQKKPQRLGSTICYGQTWARKSQQDSAVRFVTAKSWPERATETRQYDLLRPRVVQKEPPRLGSTICYGQELARKSHQDSAVRFVTAKRGPERATKIRQYDSLRPNVGQKEPPRLGSTICHGQELARKSHGDSAATKTRQYGLLRPRVGQKEPPRQYDLLRPRVGQKEPARLGSTICYGQTWARKSHQDSAVRFVTAKSWPERATVRFVTAKRGPERATETRQYDLLRPNAGQKEPPRLGSTICYGEELARKSHRDSAVLFVTAKSLARKSHQDTAVRFVAAKRVPEKATKTRQYDLLRPRVGQKEPPRLGQYDLLRPRVGPKEPPRLGSTICYGQTWARKSHQDSAVRFVTAKRGPEIATKTRQYDLLRPRVGQKEPPRLGSTICYGQELFVTTKRGPERATKTRQYDLLRPRIVQKEPPRLGSTICYGQELARKSHQDSAVRFVTAKSWPERATKTRQSDLLGHRDSAVRFVTAKTWPERATKTRQYDLLRPNVGQKEPSRLGSTICYGQELARKNHQDSAVRFVTAKRGPEKATKTRQYDLLRPNVGQKEPPRIGSTICCGQTWARKSHQDSAVRFVTAKRGPERATKTRQYDLLRPNVGQKEPPRLGSTICYGPRVGQKKPPRLRKSHQDSAVRFVAAKRAPRLGNTIYYGQEWARKSHQDSAVRFFTAKRGPERATKTRQYDLLRPTETATETRQYDLLLPNVGQKEPKTRQSDLLRPSVGQKKPARLGSTIC